jgi:hypothetical protein
LHTETFEELSHVSSQSKFRNKLDSFNSRFAQETKIACLNALVGPDETRIRENGLLQKRFPALKRKKCT